MALTPQERSKNMSAVRSKNTSPEIKVRKELHRRGLRFRLHKKQLPGNPDITLSKFKLVIFVHGCFWHQHQGCKRATVPATNQEFWQRKFLANKNRDELVQQMLKDAGWNVAIVWECETKSPEKLYTKLDQIFSSLQLDNKTQCSQTTRLKKFT